jgi:hypothetical protein
MILSHAHKFIFLKTVKVAGTSLEIALSKYCGPRDIITPILPEDEAKRRALGYRGPQNYRAGWREMTFKEWVKAPYNRARPMRVWHHSKAEAVRRWVGEEVWQGYLKISILRNPYDGIVSRYHWINRDGRLPPFRTWLMQTPELLLTNRRITHIDGVSQIDEMIRFEHFTEDLARLGDRLALPGDLAADFAAIKTKTGSRPRHTGAEAGFDGFEEGRKLVELLCREEIEAYGYRPPRTP